MFDELKKYNAVYMKWCIGYLKRDEQIKFLKKAKKALKNPKKVYTRTNGPPSYIIIMDNIDEREDQTEKIQLEG